MGSSKTTQACISDLKFNAFLVFKSCALLGDGRVLVAGGYHGFGQPDPSDLSTAEVNKPERTRESQRDLE